MPELKNFQQDLQVPDHQLSITKIFPLAVKMLERSPDLLIANDANLPPELHKLTSNTKTVKNCIIWIIDGIGTEASLTPWLKELIHSNGGWLSSVFPSTTAAAIASMLTGSTPARHGLVGTIVYLPEVATTVNLLTVKAMRAKIKIPMYEVGMNPSTWLWQRPLYEKLSSDIAFYHLIMSHLVNSGYSKIIYPDNDKNIGYWLPHDGIERMRMILEEFGSLTHQKHLFIYYNNYIDSASHHFTRDSAFHSILMEAIKDSWLKTLPRFSRKTLENTMLILASDHGQTVPSRDRTVHIDGDTWKQLLEMTNFRIGSSGRTLDLHVPSSRVEQAQAILESIIGEFGMVKTTEELLPVLDENPESLDLNKLKSRYGTIHALLSEGATFSFNTNKQKNDQASNEILSFFTRSVQTHGSLTKNELLTPFFITTLADFLDVLQTT